MTTVPADSDRPWQVNLPLQIKTERLHLWPCREGDGVALAEAIAESFGDLYPWFHDGMGPRDIETSAIWQEVVVCRSLAQFKARERLQFLAWSAEDSLSGSVELFQPDWRRRSFHFAYWARSSLHMNGYGAEAVSAIVRYGFEVLQARRITVGYAEPNTANARMNAKLGFQKISIMPMRSELPDGTFVDGTGYAMTDVSDLPACNTSWG